MYRSLPRGLVLAPLILALVSCGGAKGAPTAAAGTVAASTAAGQGGSNGVAPHMPAQDFATWLKAFEAEARGKGISQATLDAAFDGVKPLPRVIELDGKQPESKLTFGQYQERIVSAARVKRGRAMLAENRKLLARTTGHYGVPPQVVLALWGIETDSGRLTGGFNVLAALATLAHDGRRSAFFRNELLQALTILEENHLPAARMTGSWAGAMGQCQFMPSSFLKFAVDGDGDGRRDIWSSRADVFASAANYLAQVGWKADQPWAWPARAPAGLDPALASLDISKTGAEWAKLGVKPLRGGLGSARVSLVLPDGVGGPAWLVGDNYHAILRWNRSTYFAMAVGSLSERIVAE